MKFVFSHFTFPSAYLGPHFIIVTVAWNRVTALTIALGVNILLHFTLVIGLSFSFLYCKSKKKSVHFHCFLTFILFVYLKIILNGLDWSSYMWLFLYSELDHFQHCKRCYETNLFLLFSIHWFINMRFFPHVLNRNKLRLFHFAPNRGSFIQTKSCSWFPPQKSCTRLVHYVAFRIVSFPVGVPWWQWVGVWPSTFPVRNILETWREGFR